MRQRLYCWKRRRLASRKESVVIRTSLFVLLVFLIYPALASAQTTGQWNQQVGTAQQIQNQQLPQVNRGVNVSGWNTKIDQARDQQNQQLSNINRQVNQSRWNNSIRQARQERDRIRASGNPPFPFARSYRNINPFGSITNNLHRLRRR